MNERVEWFEHISILIKYGSCYGGGDCITVTWRSVPGHETWQDTILRRIVPLEKTTKLDHQKQRRWLMKSESSGAPLPEVIDRISLPAKQSRVHAVICRTLLAISTNLDLHYPDLPSPHPGSRDAINILLTFIGSLCAPVLSWMYSFNWWL